MTNKAIYFSGLNGLRFFAAFAVIVTHIELMKKYFGFDNLWVDSGSVFTSAPINHVLNNEKHFLSPLVAESGPLGVVFFFVLSGFLITYLLFREKEQEGNIDIGSFYMRRILRIWPLYFLIFIIGFFLLPQLPWFYVKGQSEAFNQNFWGNFWCYLFFVPNLAYSMFMAVPNIGQSWSIGVEEQFYLIWPVLLKYFKNSLRVILIFGVLLVAIKVVVLLLASGEEFTALRKFLAMSKLECMSLGGLGAWLVFYKKQAWLNIFFSPITQIVAIIAIPLLVYFTPPFLQNGIHLVYGFCFLVVILNVSFGPSSLIKCKGRIWTFLGKISYGIYMYHLMVIVLLLSIIRYCGVEGRTMSPFINLALYFSATLITVAISYLSYEFFEKKWIAMKGRFTKVVSGSDSVIKNSEIGI
ncbi:MAG: acyltransferase [Flavobacteriales bacterium]|nr:acyltransferase [Flavobacteriales bacterium]